MLAKFRVSVTQTVSECDHEFEGDLGQYVEETTYEVDAETCTTAQIQDYARDYFVEHNAENNTTPWWESRYMVNTATDEESQYNMFVTQLNGNTNPQRGY